MEFSYVRDRVLRRLSFGLYKGSWYEREQHDLVRTRGGVFAFDFEWPCERPDLSDLAAALRELGLSVEPEAASEDRRVLRGGSQLRTRFHGGYFVDPRHLPVRAELVFVEAGGNGPKLQLHLRDTLGHARRDIALGDRYQVLAEAIREIIDNRLKVNPGAARA
jgi:hypothetical protein